MWSRVRAFSRAVAAATSGAPAGSQPMARLGSGFQVRPLKLHRVPVAGACGDADTRTADECPAQVDEIEYGHAYLLGIYRITFADREL